jgi:phosphatidate cytidylyltransferase
LLKKRLIVGFGLLPLPVAAAWFGEPWFTALVAVFGVLAFVEFYRLRGNSGLTPLGYLGAALAVVFIVSRDSRLLGSLESQVDTTLVPAFVLVGAVALTLLLAGIRRRKDGGIAGWAWTMVGVLYLGWFLSHWVALRGLPDGRNWVFLGLLATFASDTAAFFVGRALGRHPLAPSAAWSGRLPSAWCSSRRGSSESTTPSSSKG